MRYGGSLKKDKTKNIRMGVRVGKGREGGIKPSILRTAGSGGARCAIPAGGYKFQIE